MSERPTPRVLVRLGELQGRRPWLLVVIAVLTLVPAVLSALGLGFKADFAELLPDNKDSVKELRRVSARLKGASTLTVVAQIDDGKNALALQKFVDRLVPRLVAMGPDSVGAVDYGVHGTHEFFEKHQLWYADLADLKKAYDRIVERYDWEIAKTASQLLD